MRVFLGLFFAAVLGLSPALAVPDDDNYPPMRDQFLRQIVSGKAGRAFQDEDFASIDAITALYLKTRAKTAAGAWKLGLVYDEFDDLATSNDESQYIADEHIAEHWLAQEPKSSTAQIAYAELLIAHGFFFRGGGFSSDVQASAWPKFRLYVGRAREVLEKCKSFCSAQPDWYVTMLRVANLQDWNKKSFAALFNEASSKFPDYQRIYTVAADYFSPAWHGNIEDLDTFVQDAVSKTHVTEGTIFYALIYDGIARTYPARCGCYRIDWSRMYNALVELNRRYPDPWNEDVFAFEGCLNGDRIAYKMAMAKIPKGPPNYRVWGSDDIIQICQKWSNDKFSPPGGPFNQPHKAVPKSTTTL